MRDVPDSQEDDRHAGKNEPESVPGKVSKGDGFGRQDL